MINDMNIFIHFVFCTRLIFVITTIMHWSFETLTPGRCGALDSWKKKEEKAPP